MRDLLYKNMTSNDRRRKIITSSEVSDKEGVRSVINRHFIWLVKEIDNCKAKSKPTSSVYVLKEKNTKECKQKYICRIKGSVHAVVGNRLFLIMYMHSLKINLQDLTQFSPK